MTEWRRAFNASIGLCHRADGDAAALRRARDTGLVVGVISNSNGSVRLALERAGLVKHLDFVIDCAAVDLALDQPGRLFR